MRLFHYIMRISKIFVFSLWKTAYFVFNIFGKYEVLILFVEFSKIIYLFKQFLYSSFLFVFKKRKFSIFFLCFSFIDYYSRIAFAVYLACATFTVCAHLHEWEQLNTCFMFFIKYIHLTFEEHILERINMTFLKHTDIFLSFLVSVNLNPIIYFNILLFR